MIAAAAPAIPLSEIVPARVAIWLVIRSSGRRSPITPVEERKTCRRGRSSSVATALAQRCVLSSPAAPVKALALPEFTRIAKPLSAAQSVAAAMFCSHQSTGAARVADRVKTPAIALPAAISASITSGRSSYRTPAATLAKRTPAIGGRSGKPPAGASGETWLIFAMISRAGSWYPGWPRAARLRQRARHRMWHADRRCRIQGAPAGSDLRTARGFLPVWAWASHVSR